MNTGKMHEGKGRDGTNERNQTKTIGWIESYEYTVYINNYILFYCSSLGNNPYVCDCNITSFLQRFDRNDFHGLIEDMFSITCAKPDNLNGTSFLKIIKDDISLCPEKSGKLISIN